MATTFENLIDEVNLNLSGYTLRQERIGYINNTSGITSSDLSITLGNTNNIAKGIIEIDDELLWVDSFDKNSGTLTIAPFGRGYNKTVAAAHNRYAPVIFSPTFPRTIIRQAINDTISSVYPKLWGVASTTFTFQATTSTYALPNTCQDVLSATWQSVGPTKEWLPVKKWRPDFMANSSSFGGSNKTISVYDGITPGRNVMVWYKTIPSTLTNLSDDFETVTGLPSSARDVITLGASYRILSFIDPGRLNFESAEADLADTKLSSTAGAAASKYMLGLYQQRLNEEATKLLGQYPTRPHYTSR
jgi:hypothetical protein